MNKPFSSLKQFFRSRIDSAKLYSELGPRGVFMHDWNEALRDPAYIAMWLIMIGAVIYFMVAK